MFHVTIRLLGLIPLLHADPTPYVSGVRPQFCTAFKLNTFRCPLAHTAASSPRPLHVYEKEGLFCATLLCYLMGPSCGCHTLNVSLFVLMGLQYLIGPAAALTNKQKKLRCGCTKAARSKRPNTRLCHTSPEPLLDLLVQGNKGFSCQLCPTQFCCCKGFRLVCKGQPIQLSMHPDSFRLGGRQERECNGQAYGIQVEVRSGIAL